DPGHAHAPALQVVRESPPQIASITDQGLHGEIEPQAPDLVLPVASAPASDSAAVQVAEAPAPVPKMAALPPATSVSGGECAEIELFWGDTRVSVWQLQPGDQFDAGSDNGCQALLHGLHRATVLRSDVNGWTVAAPRPLQLFLQEDGRVLGGPELLVRGRSQADAHGLVVPLPQRSVALLTSGNLSLRVRRDPGKAVARHLGDEGQAGSKLAPRRNARAERKMDDRAIVAQTGLLKALGGGKGPSDVFGAALEKGTVDAMGHLNGPRVADARGDGGLGLKSLGGRGGGGDGSGLGLARIGTNGIGGGLANYGDGKGGLRGKENGEIGLGPGKPEVVGSIDPELIRKVVHEHRAQIRTCYETQLTTRPNLAGKPVSAWTIDPTGAVTEAHTQETTLRDRTVESCVASKIRTWRFPIPKGGGEVFVTYPFIFTPGG